MFTSRGGAGSIVGGVVVVRGETMLILGVKDGDARVFVRRKGSVEL